MTKKFSITVGTTALAVMLGAVGLFAFFAFADSAGITFESPYTLGDINGQDGWSKTGAYDVEISSSYGVLGFGAQSMRFSNATASGSFGDQAISPSLVDEAGETDAVNGVLSGGVRQNHFEAQFDVRPMQLSEQPGLRMDVSPDRGDGARMSLLRFEDTPGGIQVTFFDVQGENPGFQTANFVSTVIASNLSRAVTHTAKFVIDFVDGPSNDVVEIFIDGVSVHSGTTWENYFRFDTESQGFPTPDPLLDNKSRTVDSLDFIARNVSAPATNGLGFLVDNLSLSSSTVPPPPPPNLTVDDDHVQCADATFTTIQAAVNAANPGDTIQICAGTYDQGANTITVNKSLTFSGPNATISPNGGARLAEAIIEADNNIGTFNISVPVTVVFEGLKFQTDGAEMRSDAPGATITLKKNIFTGSRADSMYFQDPNLTVDDNLFTTISFGPVSGETIQMGVIPPRVGSISITNNTWSGITGNGALNSSGQTGTVSGNTFDGVEYYGILVASDPSVSADLTISNNTFNDITNPTVGPVGNELTWGAGVRFYQANPATVASVTGNTFSNSYLGVSVRASDSDITGANIHVNNNAITGNTSAGILNAAVGTLDASCNWWGALSGPGPVGPGTGDNVSANVDFSTWLTTSNLAGPCNGPLPQVTATMVKYIDGVHATAANASSLSFPMLETWSATNFSGTDVAFDLDPTGLNTPTPYEAVTSPPFDSGADFTMHEVTGGPVVGASCAGTPFALVGYTNGDTEAAAAAAVPSLTEPSFTGMTTDKYVIVWNHKCPPPPPSPTACDTPTLAPVGYNLVNGTTGSDNVTIAPFTMFVGKGGNDNVKGPAAGNYILCMGTGSDLITLGNGDFTVSAGTGNNSITTGNGDGFISAGTGADRIITGNGVQTIDADGGNNVVRTGNGNKTVTTGSANDNITTGSGNDVINVDGGTNTVNAGGGDDSITSGSGNDTINGGADTDTCAAGGGINSLSNCEA